MRSQESRAFDDADAADFLEASADWPPRATLMAALSHLAEPSSAVPGAEAPRAVDLGCGAGTEAIELLRRGWVVDAIDGHAACLEFTRRRAEAAGTAERLRTTRSAFEELSLPPRTYAIAHAGFSIPFCRAASFDRLWSVVTESVRPGGCFAGQFFGVREPLILAAAPGSVVFHDRDSIQRLLGPRNRPSWRALNVEEVDRPGRGPRGEPKHWHVFHVLLERAADLPAPGGDGRSSAGSVHSIE